jgi:hypothetical protein
MNIAETTAQDKPGNIVSQPCFLKVDKPGNIVS